MHSQMPENLFPLAQGEGQLHFCCLSCNQWKWHALEEDPGVEQEGEEDTEPSADEEVEAPQAR